MLTFLRWRFVMAARSQQSQPAARDASPGLFIFVGIQGAFFTPRSETAQSVAGLELRPHCVRATTLTKSNDHEERAAHSTHQCGLRLIFKALRFVEHRPASGIFERHRAPTRCGQNKGDPFVIVEMQDALDPLGICKCLSQRNLSLDCHVQ